MPTYDYLCSKCNIIIEIRHEMSCEDDFSCSECQSKLEKQISSTFYVATGMKPSIADRKELDHQKKIKDPERAVRMRKKAFGHDAVGDPSMQSDPRHIVKKGRTLGGQQTEINKDEFIRAAAKDDHMVNVARKALKNNES